MLQSYPRHFISVQSVKSNPTFHSIVPVPHSSSNPVMQLETPVVLGTCHYIIQQYHILCLSKDKAYHTT